jgi:hypothetical protein
MSTDLGMPAPVVGDEITWQAERWVVTRATWLDNHRFVWLHLRRLSDGFISSVDWVAGEFK